MGFARGKAVPIYSSAPVSDIVLKEYVCGVYSPQELSDFLKQKI